MRAITIVGALLVVTWVTQTATACSCGEELTAEEMFGLSSAVFAGQVIDITPIEGCGSPGDILVTVVVTACWKGSDSAELRVATPINTACCGFPFAAGQEYLIYAINDPVHGELNGFLNTHLCTRTRLLGEAQEDLEALGPPGCTVPTESSTWSQIKALYGIDA